MICRKTIGVAALTAALLATFSVAQAFDESKYPDWNGQWRRPPGVNNQWDPTKPRYKEGAPLTPEYQAHLRGQHQGSGRGRAWAPTRPTPASPTACRGR